mmetsp:Transcript_55536/g.130864  ORF Transcript_55536/g.130864 Transcript_55536/m.130864 type:complete len:258 (+) Transcript_55536:900-1673(+)
MFLSSGMVMVPETSGHSLRMTLNSDDFPHPLVPVTSTLDPFFTSKLRFATSSVPSGRYTETFSNLRSSPSLKTGGLLPLLAASISLWSTGGRIWSPHMSCHTRDEKPDSRPMRLVSSNRSWIEVEIASMLRHVLTKYCDTSSGDLVAIPPVPSRTGLATRERPMTVTKYLLRYCRTVSELKLSWVLLRRCERSCCILTLSTRFSGPSPPRNAICSQLAISFECAPRNSPSRCCSCAESSPNGGSVTVEMMDANANQE